MERDRQTQGTDGGAPSGEQEERLRQLAAIRRRATSVAVALVREPFSASTHERMRDFVAEDADEALALAQELVALPEDVLRGWMDRLCRDGRRVADPRRAGTAGGWGAGGEGAAG
ncbi:hypothetical protein [Streptomyces alanosinicus]|uniref:Uncharacterized protein n=1 Tax=Streptomyces alanosinicus TaxID=68171 RepID=A0A918YS26_9ACTN|nr:hypothetical protein [Streptomyces alanosinicus]GHE13805.1 hypothetical protein GCM10010339_82080 [Streptomyces alanosinicus]